MIELKESIVRKGVTVYRDEIKGHIEFTGKGIQECINQPIYNDTDLYFEKMELLEKSLENSLKEAEYIGFSNYQTHPKPHVLGYHYFKTKTESGSSLYFNVQLTVQKRLVLHSITQNIREL